MKLPLKKLIFPLILIVVIALCCSYFHVSGNEIEHLAEIDKYCIVTVAQYEHMKWDQRTEYSLDYESTLELQALLIESDFTRDLGNYVITKDTARYLITIEFNDNQRHISITVLGNEYIMVSNQFNGSYLKIRNGEFEKTLYEIIHQKDGA